MSTARPDATVLAPDEVQVALGHLQSAQTLLDRLDRPEIGARLQEVIDVVEELDGARSQR
jgi:hypothetical protein